MRLEKRYEELNLMAMEIENAICELQLGYLNDDDKGYPYSDIYDLVDKYDVMYKKLQKKKYSSLNEFLNNLNANRKKVYEELSAASKYDVLSLACEKTLPFVLRNFMKYIPVDEKTGNSVHDKLFPIVKDLELSSIILLYRQLKERIGNVAEIDKGTSLTYLQQIFVRYVLSKLSHNPMNKYSRVRTMYTYEEICEQLLDEPVLKFKSNDTKKNR